MFQLKVLIFGTLAEYDLDYPHLFGANNFFFFFFNSVAILQMTDFKII